MKRIIFVFMLAVVLVCPVNAQLKVGLIGGLNLSDAKQQQLFESNAESRTNFAIGGVADFQLTENFSIMLEPLYIGKGSYGYLRDYDGTHVKISMNLSYIELPVLVKYSIGGDVKPYLFVGPSFSLKLDSDLQAEVGSIKKEVEADDVLEKFEYSFNLGGGINYQVDGLATIFFEAMYVFGLTDVVKNGYYNIRIDSYNQRVRVDDGIKYYNRSIQLLAGFTIPLNIY